MPKSRIIAALIEATSLEERFGIVFNTDDGAGTVELEIETERDWDTLIERD